MLERAIVYPLKGRGGSKHRNFELRHSLRSLEKHWQGDEPVVLLSSRKPRFLSDKIELIHAKGYMEAMHEACQVAQEILWFNDDIYLLQDMSWESFRAWRRSKKPVGPKKEADWLEAKNPWRRKLGRVIQHCRTLGLGTYKYSSHSPYLYETEKLAETLGEFDFGYKTAIETAYGNQWEVPVQPGGDKLMRYSKADIPLDLTGFTMFNHNQPAFTDQIRGFLRGLYPNPSEFEKE